MHIRMGRKFEWLFWRGGQKFEQAYLEKFKSPRGGGMLTVPPDACMFLA